MEQVGVIYFYHIGDVRVTIIIPDPSLSIVFTLFHKFYYCLFVTVYFHMLYWTEGWDCTGTLRNISAFCLSYFHVDMPSRVVTLLF